MLLSEDFSELDKTLKREQYVCFGWLPRATTLFLLLARKMPLHVMRFAVRTSIRNMPLLSLGTEKEPCLKLQGNSWRFKVAWSKNPTLASTFSSLSAPQSIAK